jgi:hypothetical protein
MKSPHALDVEEADCGWILAEVKVWIRIRPHHAGRFLQTTSQGAGRCGSNSMGSVVKFAGKIVHIFAAVQAR